MSRRSFTTISSILLLLVGLALFQNCGGMKALKSVNVLSSAGGGGVTLPPGGVTLPPGGVTLPPGGVTLPPGNPPPSFANGTYIPVLTYHTWEITGCEYSTNALMALERDLETLYTNGFTVVPAEWATEWALGTRNGNTLPLKPVVITFDDGPNNDWFDTSKSPAACANQKSAFKILQEFKARHTNLPAYSPHATSFVIASPVARTKITDGNDLLQDTWWKAANDSGLISIQNHSADHDHVTIDQQLSDPILGYSVPVAGYADGIWKGQNNFLRINNQISAKIEVTEAARVIQGKTGVWPKLFAYPFGHHSEYLEKTYFPNFKTDHKTMGAFCFEGGHLHKGSSAYCLERWNYSGDWFDQTGLLPIVSNEALVKIYVNGLSRSAWAWEGNSAFTLKYKSWGMDDCDVVATKNGAPWYTAPNNGANFDWGRVLWNETLTVTWTVTCHNAKGQTFTDTTTLVMNAK